MAMLLLCINIVFGLVIASNAQTVEQRLAALESKLENGGKNLVGYLSRLDSKLIIFYVSS